MEQALSFKLEQFEGPLDLLLQLLAKNKLSIYEIPLVQLVDQYMEQIRLWQEGQLAVASEFLEMAARLVYMKSASLLPKPEEAEALREELADELLEYQTCRALAAELGGRTEGFLRYVRPPSPPPRQAAYARTHPPEALLEAYLSAVGRGRRRLPPPESAFTPLVRRKVISVSSRIVYVLRRMLRQKKVGLRSLFAASENRSEAVATFLAVLELIRERRVRLNDQEELSLVKKEE